MGNTISPYISTMQLYSQGGGVFGSMPPAGGGGNWLLPLANTEGYFSPEIIRPRPTAGVESWSQAHNAYPGLEWNTRVGVFGGRFPFRYELTGAPLGMVVGEEMTHSVDPDTGLLLHTYNDDYGLISWPNPTTGEHVITLLVTDQNEVTDTVTWTLVVDATNFVFIDAATGDNGNAGTIAAPYETTLALHNNSFGDSSHQTKNVYLRGGADHHLVGISSENSNFTNANGASVFIGYPGEDVKLFIDSGIFFITNPDFCLKGMTLQHGATPFRSDQKMVISIEGSHRSSLFDNTINNYLRGDDTTANPAIWFITANNTGTKIVSADDQMFSYNLMTGTQGQAVQNYGITGAVFEHNKWIGCTFNQFSQSGPDLFGVKEACDNLSVRGNEMWDSNGNLPDGNPFVRFLSQDGLPMQNVESCYNYISDPGTGRGNGTRLGETVGIEFSHFHGYRDSFEAQYTLEMDNMTITPAGSVTLSNILYDFGGANLPTHSNLVQSGNIDGISGLFTSSMKLTTGTHRNNYLGTKGAELAGER